jgi:hypothetical protein
LTSPLTTVVFCHSAFSSVVETTYFGVPFIWAVIGSAGSASGQNEANSS